MDDEVLGNKLMGVVLAQAQDIKGAVSYMRKAAEAGDRDAMLMLAELLEKGSQNENPPLTVEDYIRVLQKKADKKYVLYDFPLHNSEAIMWMQKAAHLGSTRAMAIYGESCPDKDESVEWLSRAAAGGSWEAKVFLQDMWGIVTDAYASDEEYDELLKELLWKARQFGNTVLFTGSFLGGEDACNVKEQFFEIYSKLRYGTKRQLCKLAYMISACRCLAQGAYAEKPDLKHPDSGLKNIIDRHQNALFTYIDYPGMPQIGSYNLILPEGKSRRRDSAGAIAPVMWIGAPGVIFTDKNGNSVADRVVLINTGCFEENDAIIGFAYDIYPFSDLEYRNPIVTGKGLEKVGIAKYYGTRWWSDEPCERSCLLMRINAKSAADDYFFNDYGSDKSNHIKDVPYFHNPGFVYFAFSGEKDFYFEVSHHKKNGEIDILFSMNY